MHSAGIVSCAPSYSQRRQRTSRADITPYSVGVGYIFSCRIKYAALMADRVPSGWTVRRCTTNSSGGCEWAIMYSKPDRKAFSSLDGQLLLSRYIHGIGVQGARQLTSSPRRARMPGSQPSAVFAGRYCWSLYRRRASMQSSPSCEVSQWPTFWGARWSSSRQIGRSERPSRIGLDTSAVISGSRGET